MQSSAEEIVVRGRRGKNDRIYLRFTDPNYIQTLDKPAPQAIVKAISQARGFRAQRLMEYIVRSEGKENEVELDFEDADGVQRNGREAIDRKYQLSKEQFERAKIGQRNAPRHVTHMLLSAACANSDVNARRVLAAAREVVRVQLGLLGYDYILTLHRDTDHPHVHVVINNYNRDHDRRKLRINPPELFEMRTLFAERLEALGIEQSATLKRDRPRTLEHIRKGMIEIEERGTWLNAKMSNVAPTVAALNERKELARKLARLRMEIKRTTGPYTKEREAHMKAVSDLSSALVERGANLQQEVEATIRRLEKDSGQIRDFAHDLRGVAAAPTSFLQRLKRQRIAEKLTERALQNIDVAIVAVNEGPMDESQRAMTMRKLRSLKQRFSRGMDMERP